VTGIDEGEALLEDEDLLEVDGIDELDEVGVAEADETRFTADTELDNGDPEMTTGGITGTREEEA
jgi:hypothetical protein